MSQNATPSQQASFDSLSYDEEHIKDEPPAERVTATFTGQEDFYETITKGDVLWVDGDEFVVAGFGEHLLGPAPVIVVSRTEDTSDRLVAGGIDDPKTTDTFVAWGSELSELEDRKPNRSDTIATIDRVARLETGSLEYLHTWTPSSTTRNCPVCDNGLDGEPLHIEQQNNSYVEIRECVNTDCKHVYRYTQTNPDTSPSIVVEHDAKSGSFELTEFQGLYRGEEQDDFKFPLSTHDGRDDGFYTPTQITDFLNRKYVPQEILEHLDSDEMPVSVLLEPPKNGNRLEEETTTEEIAEAFITLLDEFVEDGLVDQESAHGLSPENIQTPDGELETVVIGDLTVNPREAVTHPAFYTYITETIQDPFGVVSVKTNWSDERVIEWDDEAGFNSMMTVTFTEITSDHASYDYTTFYHLNQLGHDLTEYAPVP